MKTILLATLLLLAPIPLAGADADAITARLTVNAGTPAAPAWRDCDVTVPNGANVGALLDQAEADGCILEWDYDSYPGLGRYVVSIDHVGAQLPTYWAFRINGEYAQTGIDATSVQPGATYSFTYEQWVLAL